MMRRDMASITRPWTPLAIGCTLFAMGCATVFSKSDYPVRINSTPPGAEIVVTASDGTRVFEGTTPTTVNLKTKKGFFSGQNYTIRARMSGYEPLTAPVVRSVDGWYIANVLFGGVLGLLVVDHGDGRDVEAGRRGGAPPGQVRCTRDARVVSR